MVKIKEGTDVVICIKCVWCHMRHEDVEENKTGIIYRCRHPSKARPRLVNSVSGRITYGCVGSWWEANHEYPHCYNHDGKCALYEPRLSFVARMLLWISRCLRSP